MAFLGRETEQDRARVEAQARWLQSQNVLAIVSCVLGIFSLIEFGALLVFGFAGIVTGAIALRQLKLIAPNSPRTRGHGLAWTGIITSLVSLVLATIIYTQRAR